NASARSGRYVRQTNNQFDVLIYDANVIDDGDAYVAGQKGFVIDLFTSAPVGTELLLQLETSTAEADNFPVGRHSRFRVFTTVQNTWERLTFDHVDRPDAAAPGNRIEQAVLLFAPNRMTPVTAFWDNFDSYSLTPVSLYSRQQLDFPLRAVPTPTSGVVTLNFTLPNVATYNLSLYDLKGQRVLFSVGHRSTAGVGTHEFSVADLPRGVYFAHLEFAVGVRTVKVVVQ
ncbi:MAG: T9SS type A sorting domain-containing protein, partial [Bacteroidota bacterium]